MQKNRVEFFSGHGVYHRTPPRRWYRRSFRLTWTTATHCLFRGITDALTSRLQSVQNAAARLMSGARRYDYITPVLQELHWLPVLRWVDFKMTCTPVYLPLSGRRLSAGLRWRSSSAALCRLKDVCRQTDLQQLCRQMFYCCRSKTVQQSSSSSDAHLKRSFLSGTHCLITVDPPNFSALLSVA